MAPCLARGAALQLCAALVILATATTTADDPYRFFTWNVTKGTIYPLGFPQEGILINGQFPGPTIEAVTNDNIYVNVINSLNVPFLISWNGIQQRKNSFEDGVWGTTCPIPPGQNFTYKMQMKDQIGSFYYFPSLGIHKAGGAFGAIAISSRPKIPVPFPPPAAEYNLLIGDWYKINYTRLEAIVDRGHKLPPPNAVLINGRNDTGLYFEKGKTYRLRISNVGLQNTLNFRIQGHKMMLVEVEGTHTMQNIYDSLDVHVGQSCSVLVTADGEPRNYAVLASTRFTDRVITAFATIYYGGSTGTADNPIPPAPIDIEWSLNQARTIRTNLTASAARPNPQGSYHYGSINTSETIVLSSSAAIVGGKQRYAYNGASFVAGDTPIKLADYFDIPGVFEPNSMPKHPTGQRMSLQTSVMSIRHRSFVEIVFQNNENIHQTIHLDGYAFFVVGMDGGRWKRASRKQYNLRDAISRSTAQVYPKSWTTIYVALDNVGMWNLRTEFWARQYLGQQFYLRVYTDSHPVSPRDEYPIPSNALLCGKVARP